MIVSARSTEKLNDSLAQLKGNASGYLLDLKNTDSIKAFFKQVGHFDHLVTPAATGMFAPIAEMDFEAAREILETKQWGQMSCVHYALPYLNKRGSVTLFSGTVTQKPLPGGTMFASVGAATEAAARIWAFESGPLRFNTIVPGVIETPIWNNLMGEETASATLDQIANALPVGRVGTSEDVAKAVLFVIDNEFVNGISIPVDGGHRLI